MEQKLDNFLLVNILIALVIGCILLLPVANAQSVSIAVSSQTANNGKTSSSASNLVVVTSPPHITIKENTRTSQIVQVGNILITLTADESHTKAIMEIQNLTTKDIQIINYNVTKSNGQFVTGVYCNGTLANTLVTSYDPFEPASTASILNDTVKTNTGDVAQVVPLLQNGPHYFWDSVYFVQTNSPYVKYSHPDYDNYGIATWQSCYINGNNLVHYHINNQDSNTVAQLGPVAAGAAIGAIVLNVVGAIIGACLGLAMGNTLCNVLQDENGCIWFWYAHNYEIRFFPVPPAYFYNVPSYFRIATYTLWDDIGQGNPQ